MKLTNEQLQVIREYIDESGITIQTLKDDLVDHLSCVVEVECGRGQDFEMAFRDAVEEPCSERP